MPRIPGRISVFAATLMLLAASAALADTRVLRGARVLTMDQAKPEASAIAAIDDRIAAVIHLTLC